MDRFNPKTPLKLEIERLLKKWEEVERWEPGNDRHEIVKRASSLAVLAEDLQKLGVPSINGAPIKTVIAQQDTTIRSALGIRATT